MTPDELKKSLANQFGLAIAWPSTYEVDAETYGKVCQEVFTYQLDEGEDNIYSWPEAKPPFNKILVAVGYNGGIMFKGVELILKRE